MNIISSLLLNSNYLKELNKTKDVLLLLLVTMNGKKKKIKRFHTTFLIKMENY